MMTEYDHKSYKELQNMAKKYNIPANIKRVILIRAIEAFQKNDTKVLNVVLNQIKASRKKNKTKNSYSKKKRKKSLKDPSFMKYKEDFVDSTSLNRKEIIPNSHMIKQKESDVQPNSINRITNNSDFASCPRMYPTRQQRFYPDYYQLKSLQLSSINNGSEKFFTSNDFQQTFVKSSALTSFTNLPSKNISQSFKEIDPSSYFSKNIFQPSFIQFPQFNGYSIDNINNYYSHGNFYQSYLQNSRYYEPNIMSLNNFNYESAAAQSSFYSDNYNEQVQGMEIDYSSYMLPNVSQLEANTENNLSISFSWPQNSVLSHDSGSGEFSSTSNTAVNCSNKEINFNKLQDNGGNNYGNIHTEIDSNCDDTVSLSGDIANLLDLHDTNKRQQIETEIFNASDFTTVFPKQTYLMEAYAETMKYEEMKNSTECGNGNVLPNNGLCYEGYPSQVSNLHERLRNEEYNESCAEVRSLPVSHENVGMTQLPAFSTLLEDVNYPKMNGYSCSINNQTTFSEVPPNVVYQKTYSSNSLLPLDYSQSLQSNYNGVITASSNRKLTDENDSSILRSQLLIANPEMQTDIKNKTEIMQSSIKSLTPTTVVHENTNKTSYSNYLDNSGTNGEKYNSSQYRYDTNQNKYENKNIDLPMENEITTLNMNDAQKLNPDVNESAFKCDSAHLVFKSEKLHCSKIIHENVNDKDVQEDIFRELVQIFIPKEKYETFNSPVSKIKISPCKSNSKQDICSNSITETTLQILKAKSRLQSCRTCKYRIHGCGKFSKIENLHEHEKVCLFQSIYCPSERCTWRKSLNVLSKHIYENHKMELNYRNQFVYIIDTTLSNNEKSFHTFYQVHQKVIYVIRLHLNDDKCIATVQYIPEVDSVVYKSKRVKGILRLSSYSRKHQIKSWKGFIEAYSENENRDEEDNTVRIDISNSEFISLHVFIF